VSLRAIAAGVVMLVALPVMVMLGWSADRLRTIARQDTAIHAEAMADRVARRHRQLVSDARAVLTVIAQLPRLIDEPRYCDALLQRLLAGSGEFVNFGVIGVDGRVLCSALPFPDGLNLGDRSYFHRALETKQFAAGTSQIGRITGVPSLNFGLPVARANGEVVAVVFASVGTRWLAELVDPATLPDGATLVLLDHRLNELMRYPAQAPDNRVLPVPRAALAASIERQPPGGQLAGDVAADVDRALRYIYLRLGADRLSDSPYLVLGWPADKLATDLNAATLRQPLLVLVALLLLAAVAWLVVNVLVLAPVHRLAHAASRLAEGEHGVRLPAGSRVTELVTMSDAFNHMAHRIDGAMRAYAVLSAGNRTVLREPDEENLLQAMCQVVVEEGGYRCAWVSYLDGAGVKTMASAGNDGGFAAYLQTHWQTALAHRTPTARAMISGQPVMLADSSEPAEHDLFAAASGRGLRSGLVLPLKVDARVIGALTIHAAQTDAFHAHEQALLAETADDLSFGIATARLRRSEAQALARLRQQAYFDAVTGLPNEASFLDQARAVCSGGAELAVLVVRLENYWEIAATLGQVSGDAFLAEVATRLEALAPTLLARVEQSEFALLCSDVDAAAANHQANEVLAALRAPAQLSRIGVDIAATIGIAVGGRRAGDAERLLQAAKLAAHDASRRSQLVLLAHPELDREWRDRLTMAADLRAAIDARQLRVYAQPQLDLRTGAICCMEALARWSRVPGGEVSPGRFIALAEKTGLIRPLTYAILEGVRDLAEAHARAGLVIPIAVNISARNLHDPEFVGRLADLLQRWPLPPECLHLELTETAIMQDPVHSLKVLQTLRGLGLSLYLDDFGTGYSSMAYLRELPLSGLKIDRGFISGLTQPGTHRIVQAMIDLGHALDLKVVAEGVEDDASLAMLVDLGCDVAQGYRIARPMPGSEVAAWIGRWRAQPPPGILRDQQGTV
jgi:predicted signal transduction protein with EAL and GGDEF domain/HAMP domain-containing protein